MVAAPAERVAASAGEWGEVEPLGAGGCRLRMWVDDLAWPVMILADLRADFEVVGPPELASMVGVVGKRFVAAVNGARGGQRWRRPP